jgi:hypothetical protein
VTDAGTWLDSFPILETFAPNRPLLFDEAGNPKPARDALVALLAVPEPATGLGVGAALLGLAARRRRIGARRRV